jgi:hypothetical protein
VTDGRVAIFFEGIVEEVNIIEEGSSFFPDIEAADSRVLLFSELL